MSIIEQAKREMTLANFGEGTITKMVELLEKFFDEWDSGGAVAWAQPVLMRLISGLPLTPLFGDESEWMDHGDGVFQNIRCGSVFKDPRFHDGKLAYDLDAPDPRAAITFPYTPPTSLVRMPIFTLGNGNDFEGETD